MRRRNLTMGEMSEFMAQEYGTANFARKKFGRRRRRRDGSTLTSNAVVGRTLGGRLARGAGLAAAVGLGATKRGRGLVKKGYGTAATGVKKGYGTAATGVKKGYDAGRKAGQGFADRFKKKAQ